MTECSTPQAFYVNILLDRNFHTKSILHQMYIYIHLLQGKRFVLEQVCYWRICSRIVQFVCLYETLTTTVHPVADEYPLTKEQEHVS